MITQEFISNVLTLILFLAIGATALGATQLVILLIQSWRNRRGWKRYWGA